MNFLFLLLLLTTDYNVNARTLCPVISIKPSPKPSPTPSPKPSPTPSGGNCNDITNVISTTNEYRKLHQVGALIWDSNLAKESGKYAETLSKDCSLVHSRGDYGENLYSRTSYPPPSNTCKDAIDTWYSEIVNYNLNAKRPFNDNWSKGIGHFTQLVWKSTTSFGCGEHIRSISRPGISFKLGCKIVVCRYRPPGNLATDEAFKENVLPKKK